MLKPYAFGNVLAYCRKNIVFEGGEHFYRIEKDSGIEPSKVKDIPVGKIGIFPYDAPPYGPNEVYFRGCVGAHFWPVYRMYLLKLYT